jgi:hypothetical protein
VAAIPQHLQAALKFLDMPEPEPGVMQAMAGAPVSNKQASHAPMLPQTRRALEAFYAPFNAALAEALGGDARWTWQQAEGGSG